MPKIECSELTKGMCGVTEEGCILVKTRAGAVFVTVEKCSVFYWRETLNYIKLLGGTRFLHFFMRGVSPNEHQF